MIVYTPPEYPMIGHNDRSIFLAGSIEMGQARNWQAEFIYKLESSLSEENNDIIVYNPRREMFRGDLEQNIRNAEFYQQVDWELNHLERASKVVLFFAKGTLSPISLFELGAFSEKAIVACENGYLRRGNVEIICHRYQIPYFDNMDNLISELLKSNL